MLRIVRRCQIAKYHRIVKDCWITKGHWIAMYHRIAKDCWIAKCCWTRDFLIASNFLLRLVGSFLKSLLQLVQFLAQLGE